MSIWDLHLRTYSAETIAKRPSLSGVEWDIKITILWYVIFSDRPKIRYEMVETLFFMVKSYV